MNCPDCGLKLHCTHVLHPESGNTVRYLKCESGCGKTFKEISWLEGFGPVLVNQTQKVAILADIERAENALFRLKTFVNPSKI